jgi:uncharacterized protein (DUF362 family)
MIENAQPFAVRAVACDHRASDDEVYRQLKRATDPLSRSWRRLANAQVIAIKFNQDFGVAHMFEGQRRELVCDSVARAVLRLLKQRTGAQLICVDASYYRIYMGTTPSETTQIAHLLDEYGVRYVDCSQTPLVECEVPNGNGLFGSYQFHEELVQADEIVSVAKMKNHNFMGVTGCLKNLFGLMPAEPFARPRPYYHHLVRMPYMLSDIGRILDPALNIVDGLVGQAGREWSKDSSAGRVVGTLIAGDHAVATDSCMAYLMGHDPDADWLTDPFIRDRNSLKVCREVGFGTNMMENMDHQLEVTPQEKGVFFCDAADPRRMIIDWRRSMAEQALHYRDNRKKYHAFNGEYVLLQKGEVVWHSPEGTIDVSRRVLAGALKNESLYFKYVDPEERERERFCVYERALDHIKEQNL